ncbi:MAG TPA: CotH kinase family protein [Verrucomicrobiae bacterium]
MIERPHLLRVTTTVALTLGFGLTGWAQPGGPEGFGGPPPGFGPGGFGGPGPGMGMKQTVEILKKFDKDGNGWLNAQERQEALKYLEQENNAGGRRGPGGPGGPWGPGGPGGPGGFGRSEPAPLPGAKISPAQVKNYPDVPLYASNVLRTLFLEFDSTNWEKELEMFHGTDVDVSAKLTVDGRTYYEVGVRFRGNTSYMMVGTGSKRPLNISIDMVHQGQDLMGFRTLNLLNSHEDPSFLHSVLAMQMARDYFAAPRANFVRLVINGENWGIYPNVEQFNKDFLRDNFGTTKGVRWKVPGSPGGRGGLQYLGEDVAEYRRIYQIKSKDQQKAWITLINLCKVLNETPTRTLEAELSPVLDIDSALRFFAWDNVLAGGDGFWTRASDYEMYEDSRARFHLIPYDVNETFSSGGGPGGPGGMRGPGGPGGMGGPGGPGGRGGFGPGMILVQQFLELGDKDGDGKLSAAEFNNLADAWFDRIDRDKTGQTTREQWVEAINKMSPPPPGFGPPGTGAAGQPRFGPGMFLGPALFSAADANKDQSVTHSEVKELFARWFKEWNAGKADALDEETIQNGLNASLPRPDFARAGGPGWPGGPGGPPGFGGGPRQGGTNLDPLANANDSSKPIISKLLAVPKFRARYLGYVRHMAENWLDWSKLRPIVIQYHALIADELKADTKKLSTFEEFQSSLEAAPEGSGGPGRSLKAFVEQRRTYLLNHAEVKAASPVAPR